jgi:phosphate transport system ATP-binding protein
MIDENLMSTDAPVDAGPERTTEAPPPVRRIVLDKPPTIAEPPVTGALGSWAAPAGAASGPSNGAAAERTEVYATERMRLEGVTLAYGGKPAVRDVHLPVAQGEVLALIGPSGCGKTTLLRSLNRLTELTDSASRTGSILLDGEDIDSLEVTHLRRRVSMVFQQPNPFPMSVFDNIAYALREQGSGKPGKSELHAQVVDAITRAGLSDEVLANLDHPALRLSGGQQQRLCIARAIATRPEVLLLDEPCSALDPISTTIIEDLILRLREEVAVVIVTHNLQQARRIADRVAFMYLGELVEYGTADQVFEAPIHERTRSYISGAFG